MNRYVLTAAVALLILRQSNCLEFRDGAIINRCGLWQLFTGDVVLLSVGKPPKLTKLPTPAEWMKAYDEGGMDAVRKIDPLAPPPTDKLTVMTSTPMTLSPGGVYSTGMTFQSCNSYGIAYATSSTTGSTVICTH